MNDIRLATPEDSPQAVALLSAQMAEHDIVLPNEKLVAAVEGMVSDARRGRVLLARDAAGVIGVAVISFVWTLEHGGLSAWLDELFVRPSNRSRGVGGALLQAAIEEATDCGCAAVDLEVERDHARAAGLYVRAGFRAHTRARYVLELTPSL